jgi:hypothetical protein
MLSMQEQRILRQIEHDLHRDDPRFGLHLTIVRMRDLPHRRGARIILVIELALVALAVLGAAYHLAALLILGAGFGTLLPLVALVCWQQPADPPDLPPTPPSIFGKW